jgi:5-methylcytosine-specific restriction endonuclease McrA
VSVPPTERQAAIAAGERHYFTGAPCKHGHVAKRFVIDRKCVECSKVNHDRWRAANPEKHRANDDRWRAANPDEARAARARWRAANPEKVKAKDARWSAANPEKVRASHARWSAANPEKVRAWNHTKRARRLAAEGRFCAADVTRITKAQGGKCACCRNRRKLTVDHIVPLVRGGSNWPSNLQMLCKPCNSSKNARDPITFMQEKGLLL